MKKAMYVAVALVLALSMATCEMFESLFDEPEAIEYDDEGRQLVKLEIVTGNANRAGGSRNMTLDFAQTAINYYEVMFSNDTSGAGTGATRYYRAAGPRGRTLTVRLPTGHPITGQATNAIVFAGVRDKTGDLTLLATGLMTHYNWKNSSGTAVGTGVTITPDTDSVRFLMNPVSTTFTGPATTRSSFQITKVTVTSGGSLATITSDYATGTGGLNQNRITIGTETANQLNHLPDLDTGDIYPFFKLPRNNAKLGISDAIAEATFSYGLPDGNGTSTESHYPGIRTDLSATIAERYFESYAVATGDSQDGITAVDAYPSDATEFGGASATAFGDNMAIPAKFTMEIKMKMKDAISEGYCVLLPNFSVKAISTTQTMVESLWWTLRNGLYDDAIHSNLALAPLPITATEAADPGDSSLGGAILLCIGEPASASGRSIKIILSGPMAD